MRNKVYRNSSNKDSGNDFLIPRPKLIVPIHSYAVRKRRTGNLHKQSVNYSDYENICVKTLDEDEEFGVIEDQIEDEQVYSEMYNWANNHEHAVDDMEDATPDKSPTESEEEKVEESKDKDEENEEESQERTSEWVEEQNKYFLDEESEANTKTENVADPKFIVESSLNRNDSGYYESPKKIRQRIPPRKIYPSSSELSESASNGAGLNIPGKSLYELQ
ncbi:hypothetical protein QE152_g40781 [Popillia japonica]|uniref:Uncharacterized protein n=1 Tax=Popillia japonica TaxID=7064 RepID=A0AAW1HF85_POPJA